MPTECRADVARIDALMRALDDLRHWTEATRKRGPSRDVRQQRLVISAARLRDEAWSRSLFTAHELFQVDGLHAAWSELAGGST